MVTEDDITAPICTADYDTDETVTCSAFFIYDKERQRSLQHFIQIENLPDRFDTVIIPSGRPSQDILVMLIQSTRYLVNIFLSTRYLVNIFPSTRYLVIIFQSPRYLVIIFPSTKYIVITFPSTRYLVNIYFHPPGTL